MHKVDIAIKTKATLHPLFVMGDCRLVNLLACFLTTMRMVCAF